jgi:type VI secretion system secreted protein Hcp
MLRRGLGRILLASVPVLVLAGNAAGDQVFLQLEGIEGEATAERYSKQIEIVSWSWGVSNPTTARATRGGGAASGRASVGELQLMKATDAATPKLFQNAASGKHIPKGVLIVLRGNDAGGFPYLRITLEDVVVTALQLSAGGDRPTESVSLGFTRVVIEYRTTDASGKPSSWISAGWDLATNGSYTPPQ